MKVAEIQAVDVHAHYGRMIRGRDPMLDDWPSGDGNVVVRRARAANTQWTIVSPLLSLVPRGEADAYAGVASEHTGDKSETKGWTAGHGDSGVRAIVQGVVAVGAE